METLSNGFTLDIPSGAFPLSTDSMLLQNFLRIPSNAHILDLGSGCGTLGVLLCARDPHCRVTGIELNKTAHAAALLNIRRNTLQERMISICADLRAIPPELMPGSFDCCVSNPPYFSGGPASSATPLARRDDCCTTADLFHAASRMLKYGGDFVLVQKPERLAELCVCAAAHSLEPKRLCTVRHKPDGPVNLILLSCRKGGKTGLVWENVCLTNADGTPSQYYRSIYHIQEDDHGRNTVSGTNPHR